MIRLGRGLSEKAADAIRLRTGGEKVAQFEYANASYAVAENGPPETEGTFCGRVEVDGTSYSVYMLPERS